MIKNIIVILSAIFLLSCSNGELKKALENHSGDKSIETIEDFIKNKELEKALYESALLGYSDIAAALVKSGANINEQGIDGTTPLILACKQGNLNAAKILIDNGADIYIKDNDKKIAFNYINNTKNVMEIIYTVSKEENNIISSKFENSNIKANTIEELLENINKKVIDEMNNALKKEYKNKLASSAKEKYSLNTISKPINLRNYTFEEITDYKKYIKKVGNNYYYIFSVGVQKDRGVQKEYLDSYTSIWKINGNLSMSQFGERSADFVTGFDGIALSDNINIVTKGNYITIEDYPNFEEYYSRYYTFELSNGDFYLDRISFSDNKYITITTYKYNNKDNIRMRMNEISYIFGLSILEGNYYYDSI
ncbi:ankyrin repeat domain-containing protein [Brachyspira pilosicoli]|uniref:Ankyrin repeat domain-containing protein n=1 Tax=Brachyspira pilosicoli TaxID=52584 RepID=A0AAJ6KB20_BRAPL|nr:ankyrin repeat domain-containing protein [Brachyspira pilosicoli]WIH89425.1 ankyrin repeat domain-containing protein [Brachyspira pilosicoli]WIH91719.1 ankyrin repeat domain-containing protein [Brachyspira pilosicoli]WIH93947.1 ankyrin repeat domain-containing protein [Brachyspira pilosicoli]